MKKQHHLNILIVKLTEVQHLRLLSIAQQLYKWVATQEPHLIVMSRQQGKKMLWKQ